MSTTMSYRTLRESVADVIRNKILNHELQPGMRIIEHDIATELSISRGPIREALRQLEQEGLVVYARNTGCSVRDVSLIDVLEVYTVRGSFELTALKSIGGKFSQEALDEMYENVKQMKEMTVMDSITYDNQFHDVAIQEAKMHYLYKAWKDLEFVNFFSYYIETEPTSLIADRQYVAHKYLYDVYCTGDLKEMLHTLASHYLSSIRRKMQEHHLTEADLPFSLSVLTEYEHNEKTSVL